MTTVDHLKLAQRDPEEVAKLRAYLLQPEGGLLEVRHRPGNTCCLREPWMLTYQRLHDEEALGTPLDTLDIDLRDAP